MACFYVEPEVAGGLGPNTVMDRSADPVRISHLHYEFDGWQGDQILESTPAWIVTEDLARSIEQAGLSGVEFGDVEVSASEQFREFYPDRELPSFVRLTPTGTPCEDDFGVAPDRRLVASDRALAVLQSTDPVELYTEPYDAA